MSSSLADIYKNKCSELAVKCNSGLLKVLGETQSTVQHLSLDGNVVGPRGLLAFLEVVAACPNVVSLNLRGNNLNSNCIRDLCAVAKSHPSLRNINLNNNDIRLAGPDLVDLLKRNTKIVVLSIEDTFLRPLFVKLIHLQVARNAANATPEDVKSASNVPSVGPSFIPNKKGETAAATAVAAPAPKKSGPKFAEPVAPKEEEAAAPPPPAAAHASGDNEEGDPQFVSGFAFGVDDPAAAATDASADGGFGTFSAFGGGGDSSPSKAVHVSDKVEVMSSAYEMQGTMFKRTAGRRPTVSAEVFTEDEISNFKPQVIPKDEAVRLELMRILEKNNLFSHLEDFELFIAVDQMQDSNRCNGDAIYDEGDEDGDTFYVLYSGEVSLTSKDNTEVRRVKAGECFADVMLLYSGTYDHTATCVGPCVVYSLMRPAYKFILTQSSKKKRAKYEGFLSSIGFLKGLQKQELLQLADALKSKQFEAGESLITYGETGEHFYIVVEGKVEVIGRENGKPKWVCDFAIGDCVGELEFLNNHKCVADVKAKTPLRVAMMNRHHFEMVMGPVKDVLARIANESHVYEYYRQQLAAMKEE
eukprot:PhM_4_TR17286/c0_g1_i1/m.9513/K04739/PRKAR; cAMP-dependent protein kinase regulator